MSLDTHFEELMERVVTRVLSRLPAPASAAPLKLGYTIPEAVQTSGFTENAIRTAIKRGELHARQSGQGGYVIHHAELDAWIRGVPTQTTPARKGVRQARPA